MPNRPTYWMRLNPLHCKLIFRISLWAFSFFAGISTLFGQTAPLQKCSPALSQRVQQREEKALRLVLVVKDWPPFKAWAEQEGLVVHAVYPPANIVVLEDQPRHFWEILLPRPDLIFADLGHESAQEEQVVPGHNLFANNIQFAHIRWPELDGRGVTLSIKEFRFDSADADLKNRVLPMTKSSSVQTVHAGIMATLAAGAGNTGGAARGVARGARVLSSNFAGLLPDDDADYDQYQVSVQNHSYGLDIENYYGAGALAYDQSTQDHPGLLHVFSAGNIGGNAPPDGIYAGIDGFANLTGNFKMAKNVLIAGAVDSFGVVPPYSSHGPAFDGRLKPDLVAFGSGGTSESAALVSGAALVVQQAFYEKYGFWPGSAAVRAILIGSAKDVGSPGPDFTSGYGNLDLKEALNLVQNQFTAQGTLEPGEQQVFSIEIPAGIRQFRAVLAWNDIPATPNVEKALVNDLDLEWVAPDGSTGQPWVLNTFPDADSLSQPARRGRDSLNTIEMVSADFPIAGTYQIRVSGDHLPSGSQSFALAATWDTLDAFEWTSPVRDDPFTGKKVAVLRWKSGYQGEAGLLEWKASGSTNWQLIDAAVMLDAGYYRWTPPDVLTAAQLRMRVSGNDFVSDTFFIGPSLRLRIGFNCPDSLLLMWESAGMDAVYRLWGLEERYLELLSSTRDTFIVLQKSDYPQERFAVSVRSPDDQTESATSSSPDIRISGESCYINYLLAILNEEETIDLRLNLGSLYGVGKVLFEKLNQGGWMVLSEKIPDAFDLFHTDQFPQQGLNMYRAVLEMENGGVITSDPVTVYYAGKNGFLLFPNPAYSGQVLRLLFRFSEETPEFLLFDVLGKQVLKQPLEGYEQDILMPALSGGCYFWMVRDLGGVLLGQGRLLVYPR